MKSNLMPEDLQKIVQYMDEKPIVIVDEKNVLGKDEIFSVKDIL